MYDTYISLGSNCEAGFQLKRIGHDESSFFRWTLSPYKSTFNLIENDFQNLYQQENLVPVWDNMVEDKHYKISFHSKLLSRQDEKTKQRVFLDSYDFEETYQAEYAKIQYFVQKWYDLVNSDRSVLYIIKQEQHGSKYNAKKLLDLFEAKYPQHNFAIAYIQHQEKQDAPWEYEKLHNLYFPRFAPIDRADCGDLESWDQLFARFPLKQQVLNSI